MPWSWLSLTLEHLNGIEPYEALQALSAPRRWPRPVQDTNTGATALLIYARTDTGRPLKVAVRPYDKREWQIIAVRDLTADELKEFEAWEEGRA